MTKVLWLSSWYPNNKNPYEGDFIQRHAKSVSEYIPVILIHVTQYGEKTEANEDRVDHRKEGNLHEIVVYFKFKKTGFLLFDKIRYNKKFFSLYKKFIRNYFEENEKPMLIHLHIPMKAGVIARYIKKNYRIPYVLSEHSSSYYKSIPANYFSRNFYYRRTVRKIFDQAICVTTVSEAIRDRLQTLFKFKNSSVIRNVVDTHLFYLKDQPKIFRFIHASTMTYAKNIEGMLRALSKLKTLRIDWELVMLGWDSDQLKQLGSDLGLNEFILWKGVVTYSEVAIEMQQSSALLMFSRYENFPCTIIEALCCGLPAIASNVGGIPEVITKENGILVESENENQLLEALKTMIADYSFFDRKKIAESAQSKFNYQVVGKQIISLYEQNLSPDKIIR